MNRRTFLKSIAIACGAAVVCPGELLKKHRHPGIDKMPSWVLIKGSHDGYIKLYGKHGQHCCCNSCVEDIMADCLPSLRFRGTPIYYQSPLYDETTKT